MTRVLSHMFLGLVRRRFPIVFVIIMVVYINCKRRTRIPIHMHMFTADRLYALFRMDGVNIFTGFFFLIF